MCRYVNGISLYRYGLVVILRARSLDFGPISRCRLMTLSKYLDLRAAMPLCCCDYEAIIGAVKKFGKHDDEQLVVEYG
jgi:hypothetical protein